MYEIVDRGLAATVGVRVGGTMDDVEYAQLQTELEQVLGRAARVNFVCEMGPNVEVKPTVFWDDMNFGRSHAQQIGRVAIVADDGWAPLAEIYTDRKVDARLFPPAEVDTAWRWASEG